MAIGLFERDLGVTFAPTWPAVAIECGAELDWTRVRPEVLGEFFERSLQPDERHAGGVHYTEDAEILDAVLVPTIAAPWAACVGEPRALHARLLRYRVLDPACGAGNFLLAAYRHIKEIEARLGGSGASPGQLLGIDRDPLAVEVARVALQVAHVQATGETVATSVNIKCMDALVDGAWPEADVIVGNPPFLDARRIGGQYGREYVQRLRRAYPDVPGRADLCVYWFRRAHQLLKIWEREDPVAGRAGLVGTKTIRENYSRAGGLERIVAEGGVIVDAVSSRAWPGAAAVDVAIVNWVKGAYDGPRYLRDRDGVSREVAVISSSLTAGVDVAGAAALEVVTAIKKCFEGQQPGHVGFRVDAAERGRMAEGDPRIAEVVFPYLNGEALLTGRYKREAEWVVDFGERSLDEAARHGRALAHVEHAVLPAWRANALREGLERGAGEHQRRERVWWRLKRRRGEMLAAIAGLPRYIVCVRHTQRPIFVFLDPAIRPDSALTVFAFADDYSFGVLQSSVHWRWFTARCSSLSRRFRYTSETVFDAFPWPQRVSSEQMAEVARCAREMRAVRAAHEQGGDLRGLYRRCEEDAGHPLRAAHAALDEAVLRAYGFAAEHDLLAQLLALHHRVAADVDAAAPGGPAALISGDCVAPW